MGRSVRLVAVMTYLTLSSSPNPWSASMPVYMWADWLAGWTENSTSPSLRGRSSQPAYASRNNVRISVHIGPPSYCPYASLSARTSGRPALRIFRWAVATSYGTLLTSIVPSSRSNRA